VTSDIRPLVISRAEAFVGKSNLQLANCKFLILVTYILDYYFPVSCLLVVISKECFSHLILPAPNDALAVIL